MIRCDKCPKPAVTFIRYSGAHLCGMHFSDFVERRVKKEMRKQFKLNQNDVFVVALSGGKDSVVALHVLHDILGSRKDIEIHAVSVDEGIEGYRPESIEVAAENCRQLDIAHHIVSFKDVIGITMDEIPMERIMTTPCSYCGVFRRKCLNKKARELGATRLATGLNLDDTAQSLLMNFARGDISKMARLGPHIRIQPDLVPRIQPLRVVPEKESYLFATLNNIPFHEGECPYSERAQRGRFRNVINDLERDTPGTRHAILQSYDSISRAIMEAFPPAELKKCSVCGEPTLNEICKSCSMHKDLRVLLEG